MKFLFLPLLMIFLVACENKKPEKSVMVGSGVIAKNNDKEPLTRDTLIHRVKTKTGSHALYLPSGYNSNTTFPAFLFFDPHGDGSFPLKKYRDLADSFGFILIGSNDSRNGLDLNLSCGIAGDLLQEVLLRYQVNRKKIAFCGFSGGAKVALSCGGGNKDVSTIIYCGAAIPVTSNHKVSLLGFAGRRDMNYTDVVQFHRGLPEGLSGRLVEWDGGHEFPAARVFKDAFIYIESGEIPGYSLKQATITPGEIAREQKLKQKYLQAFQSQDIEWWKKEIQHLREKQKQDEMYERLLGFISLACYSIINNSLSQQNLDVAGKILDIYELADPENEDYLRFRREYERRKG